MTCSKYTRNQTGDAIGSTGSAGRGLDDGFRVGVSASPSTGLFIPNRPRGGRDNRGLDSLERKAFLYCPPAEILSRRTGLLPTLSIGVPFTAVFVMGCLTFWSVI